MIKIVKLPEVKLTNGLVVANYSSPHPFRFEDDSVLPACTEERAIMTMLNAKEIIVETRTIIGVSEDVHDIKLEYKLTWFLEEDIAHFMRLYEKNMLPWHYIITPLPVVKAMEDAGMIIKDTPFRTGRLSDRIDKTLYKTKFCVL